MTISNRLTEIKGLRSVLQWERQAGIARGNLDRSIRDGKLSDETILKLIHYENVRADWLLTGKGAPYQTATFNADIELSEQLCAYHTDEAARWTLTLIVRESDNLPCAVVLTMPGGNYPIDKLGKAASAPVEYTIVEILVGPIGRYSRAAINRNGWGQRQQLTLDDTVTEILCAGGIGTYVLMQEPGYLKAAVPFSAETLELAHSDVTDTPSSYTVPLAPPEQRLLTTYRAMPNDDRERLLAIAEALKGFSS